MENLLARIRLECRTLYEHLGYWLAAREAATRSGSAQRIAECERFVGHSEKIIALLAQAAYEYGKFHEHLGYWLAAHASAGQAGDAERIAECERFVGQCEKIITALRAGAPRPMSKS